MFYGNAVSLIYWYFEDKHKKFHYISAWLSHIRKPWKLGKTALKILVSHTGLWQPIDKFDDLVYNDAIKSS